MIIFDILEGICGVIDLLTNWRFMICTISGVIVTCGAIYLLGHPAAEWAAGIPIMAASLTLGYRWNTQA